ncbi:uncharacterized protein LOC133869081 [Alnus glutinosa]|uniref:uncharacterized protein LOC133869081 n=1 Tax=Alnus glutinosa TaxID=3517 RepID=UPI002D79AE7A|nr:uncharacterized protein LOC133869081 [Alnus glutinosa]
MVLDMKEKVALIRKQMLTAQSQQKSYVGKHLRKLEFEVGDLVYLKVSPMQGIMHFGNAKLKEMTIETQMVKFLSYKPLNIQANLTYEELPVQVLNPKEEQLRTKTITLAKILWQIHGVKEASWELEQKMQD